MRILLIAEHDNIHLKPVNASVLAAAHQLNGQIDILVAGMPDVSLVQAAAQLPSVHQVLTAMHPGYTHCLPENLCLLIAKLAVDYDYVMMAATSFGKNILPRVAGILHVGMVSDVITIVSSDTFERPIYAGNAVATMQLREKIKLLTVRATAFCPLQVTDALTAPFYEMQQIFENTLSRFVDLKQQTSTRPELTEARIVVSGGRGFKSAENFHLLEQFADSIGAAVGASRAAVDAGFAPNDWQVGQTGKIVAPDLYIAVGISGAIQHLAGIKDSKVIVAINSDPDAPIFKEADYGLVGDLFQILPSLQDAFQHKVH